MAPLKNHLMNLGGLLFRLFLQETSANAERFACFSMPNRAKWRSLKNYCLFKFTAKFKFAYEKKVFKKILKIKFRVFA